jgi:hypothetical protein
MTGSRCRPLRVLAILVLGSVLVGCGGKVELAPEIEAHLQEYENLIASYEEKFANAAGDPTDFARVSASYTEKAKAWMSKWKTVAPDLSEKEGKALKARIDKLNERALRMLGG